MDFQAYQQVVHMLTQGTLCLMEQAEYKAKYDHEKPLMVLPIQGKEDVAHIRHVVDSFLQERIPNWKDPARNRILVGLTEAVTNVVKHTPGGQVLVYIDEVGPRFHVLDEGPGLKLSSLSYLLFAKGFSTSGSLGAGFPVMMAFFKQILVCSSPEGTKLVLRSDLSQASEELGGSGRCS